MSILKKSLVFLILVISCFAFYAKKDEVVVQNDNLVQTIAFGSCNKSTKKQPLWNGIIANEPDVWVWLGDNIYGDSSDPDVLAKKYATQLSQPAYKKLVSNTKILGTWDDHDYGKNDAGKEFEGKEITKAAMLKFLGIPETDPVWSRPGVYHSRTFGPDGKKVKFILLDSRSFRDQPIKNGKKYEPNLDGTILGDAQWDWLENELHNSDAQIHIIANGIQIIPNEHRFEKWGNFPNERKRLFRTVVESKANNVILLSGDRHAAEISKIQMGNLGSIHEVTASGLTHATSLGEDEPNRYRVGPKRFCELNFGVIDINWNEPCSITLSLKGKDNKLFQTYKLPME